MSVRTSSFQSGLLSTCTRPSLPQNLPMTSHFRNFKNLTTLLVFRSSFSAAQNSTNKTVYLLTLVFHSSVTAISVKCRRGPEARLARGQWLTASDKKKRRSFWGWPVRNARNKTSVICALRILFRLFAQLKMIKISDPFHIDFSPPPSPLRPLLHPGPNNMTWNVSAG